MAGKAASTRRAVMWPVETVHLGPEAFGDTAACLGGQLTELLQFLGALQPNLTWHVADIECIGTFPVSRREPAPTSIGDTATLMQAALRVSQFESGVFAGVAESVERPAFRPGGLWTEDEEAADLGDAL